MYLGCILLYHKEELTALPKRILKEFRGHLILPSGFLFIYQQARFQTSQFLENFFCKQAADHGIFKQFPQEFWQEKQLTSPKLSTI